jgi:hypothetical protein
VISDASSNTDTANSNGVMEELEQRQPGSTAGNDALPSAAYGFEEVQRLHREPVDQPLVDELLQILGNSVVWSWRLYVEFLTKPILPGQSRLSQLRQASQGDPNNAEK